MHLILGEKAHCIYFNCEKNNAFKEKWEPFQSEKKEKKKRE